MMPARLIDSRIGEPMTSIHASVDGLQKPRQGVAANSLK